MKMSSMSSEELIAAGYSKEMPNTNTLVNVEIGDGVMYIGSYAFLNCSSLTSITIPESVASINGAAFYGCKKLTNVRYSGTQEQWNAITKGSNWNYNVPATYVQCFDGQVSLQ